MKTQKRGNIYKGPTSSEEFNQIYNDAADDIKQLFSDMEGIVDQKTRIANILSKENMFLYNKIQDLYALAVAIENKVDKILTGSDDGLYTMFRRFNNIYDILNWDTTNIDTVYRTASIRGTGNPISRTHVYNSDTGDVFIPKGLELQLSESLDGTFQVVPTVTSRTDSSLLNAINHNSTSYFVRELPSNGTDTLYVKLTIKVPIEFINSLACNSICINPFPSYSMSLYKVEYKNQLGQVVTLFDEEHTMIPKTNIQFATVRGLEYYIYLKQKPLMENSTWKFTYGFQYLDLLCYDSTASECSFVSKHKLDNQYFSIISEPTPEYAPMTQVPAESNLVTFQLYDQDMTEVGFNTSFMAYTDTVYIKTTIKRSTVSGYAPVLSGIKFDYMVQ